MAFFSNLMQSPAGGKGGGGFLEALRRRIDMDRLLAAQAIVQGDPRGAMEIRARRQARDADQVAAKMRSQGEGEPTEERRGAQAVPSLPVDSMPALAAAQGFPAGAGPRGALMRPLAMQVDSFGLPDYRTFLPQDGASSGRSIGRAFGREAARIANEIQKPRQASASQPADDPRTSEEKLRLGINGYGYIPTDGDELLLARALYSEFGREDNWDDMRAGAWSIMNRIRPTGSWPGYRTSYEVGPTLREVLERRNPDGVLQYSFMPAGGIGAPGGSESWQASADPKSLTGRNRVAWQRAMDAATQALTGRVEDPTGGATFFHNVSVGTPDTVEGFFHDRRGRTIELAPYTSPHGQNFFYRHLEDSLRPVPWLPRPGSR